MSRVAVIRRAAVLWLLGAGVTACLLLCLSSGARGTEVSAGVQSLVSLSLRQVSPARLQATLTATVGATGLTAARAGSHATVSAESFPKPVSSRSVTITIDPNDRGVLLVTAGPQTP